MASTSQKILAIETSCDETAAAVIVGGKIKSSIIASQAKLHSKFGGVVPEVAAREHVTAIIPTIDLALKKAKTKLSEIDFLSVTQGPGLFSSLSVGVDTCKALSVALEIPLLPINHLEAHIYANFIKEKSEGNSKGNQKGIPSVFPFPSLILIVSGGHTLLVLMKNHGNYKIIGETVDDAAGEAFDKTAKLLGLAYPGGPILSKLAKDGNPKRFQFPRPMINSNNLNFSFSGLKTAVLYEAQKYKKINPNLKNDFAASIQKAIVDVLIAKTEKAILKFSAKGGSASGGKPKTIMLGGGVAANHLLRKRFSELAKKYHIKSSIPKIEYCTDNAAMIGLAAYYRIKSKKAKFKLTFSADPNLVLK